MKIDVDPVDILERKADERGRVNLGADYGGETVRVAVVDVDDDEDEDEDELTPDGGAQEHQAADLETVVVDPEDVLEMMRRNARDADEQRTHVLRVTPPFEGERRASLHVDRDETRYDPDKGPLPLHLGARAILLGDPAARLDNVLQHPDWAVERQMCRSEHDLVGGEELPEEEWEEWWDVSMEVWEKEVRRLMQEDREIRLGGPLPEQPETTVTVRFDSE